MKIRTDFVTNSSSSSFVTARIETKSQELLEAMKTLKKNCYFTLKINANSIFISDNETACCFNYNDPKSPKDVIEVFAELLENDDQSETGAKLLAKKDELADSIEFYQITVGETGNSSDSECLCEDYVNHIIETEYADSKIKADKLFDLLWDALLDSDEWVSEETNYVFDKNMGNIKISSSMWGPLDDFPLEEDAVKEFEIDELGCLIEYNGVGANVVIPDGVTSIDDYAFEGCESLQSITIPDSVTSIGCSAFEGCTSLQSITIPESVTKIGSKAFNGCQSITAPNRSIENWDSSEPKRTATLGYLQKRELFLDADIAEGYKKYAVGQRKKLLPVIFKNDMVTALAFYAEAKKITAKNFEEEYLNPAKEANAEACVAFLLDWQNKKTASKK